MGDEFHLMKTFGTAAKQNLTESSFFEISSSNLEHNLFRFMALIFLQFYSKMCFLKYIFHIKIKNSIFVHFS